MNFTRLYFLLDIPPVIAIDCNIPDIKPIIPSDVVAPVKIVKKEVHVKTEPLLVESVAGDVAIKHHLKVVVVAPQGRHASPPLQKDPFAKLEIVEEEHASGVGDLSADVVSSKPDAIEEHHPSKDAKKQEDKDDDIQLGKRTVIGNESTLRADEIASDKARGKIVNFKSPDETTIPANHKLSAMITEQMKSKQEAQRNSSHRVVVVATTLSPLDRDQPVETDGLATIERIRAEESFESDSR